MRNLRYSLYIKQLKKWSCLFVPDLWHNTHKPCLLTTLMGFDCLRGVDLRTSYYVGADLDGDSLVNDQILRESMTIRTRDASYHSYDALLSRTIF